MAKKKKNNGEGLFKRMFGGSKSKPKSKPKKTKGKETGTSNALKVLFFVLTILVLGGIGWGFKLMEGYVLNDVRSAQRGGAPLKLRNPPKWLNRELEGRIYSDARRGIPDLAIDEHSAMIVAENLKNHMEWLNPSTIVVSTTDDDIEIFAQYRKPVLLFKYGKDEFYVDENLTLLSSLPMQEFRIVEVKDYDKYAKPVAGMIWRQDDIESAILLVKMLNAMEERRQLSRPLLSEIDYIDLGDFGSRDIKKSQLTLVAKDGTKILWGAPPGKASINLEADESEKLEKFYGFYEQFGTLQGIRRYIDLRIPEKKMPLP